MTVSKNGSKIKKVTDTIKTNSKSISKAQINAKSNLQKVAIKSEPSGLNAVESDSIEFKGDDDRVSDEGDEMEKQVLLDDTKVITKAPRDISRVKKKRSHDAKMRRRKHAKDLKKQARKSAQETTDP